MHKEIDTWKIPFDLVDFQVACKLEMLEFQFNAKYYVAITDHQLIQNVKSFFTNV